MLHLRQRLIGVGLDAQLKGPVHGLEADPGGSVGELSPVAVAAVAALLGLDIRLGHVRHAGLSFSDGELLLHIAVALAGPPAIPHPVKAAVQTEDLAEAGEGALAPETVQAAGDQNAVLRALVGICELEDRQGVPAQPGTDFAAVGGLLDREDRLFGSVPLFHGVAALGVPVVVRGGPPEARGGRRGRELVAVGQVHAEPAVGEADRSRKRTGLRQRQLRFLQRDLLHGNLPAGAGIGGDNGGHETVLRPCAQGQLHPELLQRIDFGAERRLAAVVPAEAQPVGGARRKGRGVEELEGVALQVPDPDGPVEVTHDPGPGRWAAVRVEETVHAEVSVVGPFPVIAAVAVAAVGVEHRVIDHLPHAAAQEIVVGVDELPVGLGVAGAHAHGVGVLAEEVGPVVQRRVLAPMLGHGQHVLGLRVHLAAHVVGLSPAVDDGLVVDGQGGPGLEPAVHGVGVFGAAGLVAQGPHQDTAVPVELVPAIEPGDPVQIPGLPAGVVGDQIVARGQMVGPGAVGLQVVFVDDVEAQLLRQLQEQGIGGIVGGTDCVDVEGLAGPQVPLDLGGSQGVALHGGGIVVVDALELQLFPVEQEDVAPDLHGPEAEAFLDTAAFRLIVEIVEDGGLRVPFRHRQVLEAKLGFPVDYKRLGAAGQAVAGQGKADPGPLGGLGAHGQGVAAAAPFRLCVHVPKIRGLGDPQQHVPEDAVVPEHVLAFQIGPGTPAAHQGQQLVLPRMQEGRQVELRRVVGALGVADELPVGVELQTAGDAEEGDHVPSLLRPQLQKAAVDAHEVVLVLGRFPPGADSLIEADPGENPAHGLEGGDSRGIEGELIADVQIEGPVDAVELPAARDGHDVKAERVGIQLRGQLGGPGIEFEIPVPVQTEDLGRPVTLLQGAHGVGPLPVGIGDEIASGRELVPLMDRKAVVVFAVDLIVHGSVLFLADGLSRLVDVAGAHGQDDVPRAGDVPQIGGDLRQGVEAEGSGDLGGQIAGVDVQGVPLPGGVDFRQHQHVGLLQLLHELAEQGLGPGEGVGLEGHDDPLVAHGAHGLQHGPDLVGMMGVVVVDVGAVAPSLEFEPPPRAPEAAQTLCGHGSVDAHMPGHGAGAQGVDEVELAVDREGKLTVGLPAADHRTVPPVLGDLFRVDVVARAQAKGEIGQTPQGVGGVEVVAVGDDHALGGHQLGEIPEGGLDLIEILEEIQMVLLDVVDDGNGGGEVVEGVAVFAALGDDGVAAAHPVPGVEQGQIAADHDRRVLPGLHKDVGDHGGGGGLAMGAGDADRVLVLLHQHAPGLGPLEDGDAGGSGGGDLGVVVVGGGGPDDAGRAPDVLRPVADVDGDPGGPELVGGDGGIHVGAGDLHAALPKHQGQGTHGNAADAHQMNALAGLETGPDLFYRFRLHTQCLLLWSVREARKKSNETAFYLL